MIKNFQLFNTWIGYLFSYLYNSKLLTKWGR